MTADACKQVGALGKAKMVLREVVQLPLQQPALFAKGSLARPTKGILLFGPPGAPCTQQAWHAGPLWMASPCFAWLEIAYCTPCVRHVRQKPPVLVTIAGTGKTLLAKATAAECGASFLAIAPSTVTSKWVGESVRIVRACFSLAAKLAPCVLFLDEVVLPL